MAIHSSRGVLPLREMSVKSRRGSGTVSTYAWVTQATSGAKPAIWSFSLSSTFFEMNMGKAQFLTPNFLILALNHV